ncbi:MAG: RsmD family RNA methyltransferase [Opitutales bacterium]
MRISGGKAKSIILNVPKARKLRPVLEPARERLFSSLGKLVEGASFLDLFAGTGSHGLEALSRGAARGAFVELDSRTVTCLRRNLAATCKSAGTEEKNFEILTGDALRATPRQPGPFDLVFADPPYSLLPAIAPKLFLRLLRDGLADLDSLVILGMPGNFDTVPEGWRLERRLGKPRKGSPTHGLFRPVAK